MCIHLSYHDGVQVWMLLLLWWCYCKVDDVEWGWHIVIVKDWGSNYIEQGATIVLSTYYYTCVQHLHRNFQCICVSMWKVTKFKDRGRNYLEQGATQHTIMDVFNTCIEIFYVYVFQCEKLKLQKSSKVAKVVKTLQLVQN